MENELTLFGDEKFTTRQLAEQFGTRPNVITENGKKCFPNKVIENGKPTYWSKAEVMALVEQLKCNQVNGRTFPNLSVELKGLERCERDSSITTMQFAKQLGTSPNVVLENARKCLPKKKIENGKSTYWTKEEVTILLDYMKSHTSNNRSAEFSSLVANTSTELTPALKIKKAMELMMEGYEEELAILREKNEAQRAKLEEQAPKVEVFDRIADSSGLKSMQEVAKILKIGVNTLFALLRDAGIFYRSNGVNVPHDEHIRRGRFEVKEEPFMRDGKPCAYTRIFVTEKGLVWLAKLVDNSENKI